MTGEQIKTLRIKNNLSQEDFAKLIGTTQKSVSAWETGKVEIKYIKMRNIHQKIEQGVLKK